MMKRYVKKHLFWEFSILLLHAKAILVVYFGKLLKTPNFINRD